MTSAFLAIVAVISLTSAALCFVMAVKSKLSSPVTIRSLERLRLSTNEQHSDLLKRIVEVETEMDRIDTTMKSLKGSVGLARREAKRNATDRMMELALAQMQSAGVPLQVPPNQQP